MTSPTLIDSTEMVSIKKFSVRTSSIVFVQVIWFSIAS